MRLEALERRDCPAVMFDFVRGDEGGVLTITGDEEDNYIAMQSVGGGIQVALGDGSVRVFEDVAEIVVNGLGGADTVDASKIWVFGTELPRIQIHAGAGDDRVTIGDDEPTGRRNLVTTHSMDAHVDLGAGADDFSLQLDDHDQVDLDLDLTAEDGSDKILIGLLVPAVQKVRAAAARMSLDLVGDGNVVAVNAQDFDQIDLGLRADGNHSIFQHELGHTLGLRHEHTRPEARVNFDIHGDGNQLGLTTDGVEQVDLDLGLTGDGNQVAVGMLLPAVQKVRDSAARIRKEMVGDGNLAVVRLENIENVDLSIVSDPATPEPVTGGNIQVYWHVINRSSGIAREEGVVILANSLPGGAAGDADMYVKFGSKPTTSSSVDAQIITGRGDDTVSIDTTGLPNLNLALDTGAGNDRVSVNGSAAVEPNEQGLVIGGLWNGVIDLGTGADELDFQVEDHDTVNVDVNSTDSFDSVQVGVQYPLAHPIRLLNTRSATVDLNLAGGGHTVDVQTQGLDELDLNLVVSAGRAPSDPSGENVIYISTAGGGVWKTAVEVGGDRNLLAVTTKDVDHLELDATISGGSNTVQFVGSHTGDLVGIDFRPSCRIDLNFGGGGNNVVDVRTENVDEVTLDLLALGGNNVVKHELGHSLGFRHEHTRPESAARANVALGGDDNIFSFKLRGIDEVDLDLDLTGNDNRVEIGLLLPAVQKVREAAARVSLDMDGSNNQGTVSNDGYADWRVNFGRTASSSDPASAAATQGRSLFAISTSPIPGSPPPTGTVTFFVDGNPQAPGSDTIEVHGQGFGAATVEADTAGGNDSIWIDIGAPVLVVRANLGDGDDTVVIDPAQSIVFVATGEGDADIDLDLGEGNDVAEISIEGFSNVLLGLTAGPGDDVVQVQAVTGRITGVAIDPSNRDTIYSQRVDLGEGDDVAEISIDGFSNVLLGLTAGDGNDTVTTRSNVFAVFVTTGFPSLALDLETGAGDDEVMIHNSGFSEVTRVDSGDGDDSVQVDSRAGVGILKSTDGGRSFSRELGKVTYTLVLGSGNDSANINTIGYGELNGVVDAGDGDDTIISNSSPASPGASPRPVLLVIANRDYFLGAGDDRLVINTSGEARSDIYIDAGAGNDSASNRLYVGNLSYDAQHTRLNAVALLGAGDDRLETDTAGYGQANILIDGGDGNDEVRTRHQWLTHLDRTQLNLVVLLGAGSDTLAIETAGYRRIKTAINTGPAGDGSDSVSASHQSQRRSSRRHNVRLNLDGGRDAYRHTTKGYAVQKTVQSATSVEWVFVS